MSLNAMFAWGGGWQFEFGRVWDNQGGKKWFFNSGPTVGIDLSFGIQQLSYFSDGVFTVDQLSGKSTSVDAALLCFDWMIVGGDNFKESYKSPFGKFYTENGWGISIGSPIGGSWQMGNTIIF